MLSVLVLFLAAQERFSGVKSSMEGLLYVVNVRQASLHVRSTRRGGKGVVTGAAQRPQFSFPTLMFMWVVEFMLTMS